MGWATPTLQNQYDEAGNVERIVVLGDLDGYGAEGGELRLTVEMNVAGEQQCAAVLPSYPVDCVCPLIEGHIGDHWQADPEVAEQAAPIRVWAEVL